MDAYSIPRQSRIEATQIDMSTGDILAYVIATQDYQNDDIIPSRPSPNFSKPKWNFYTKTWYEGKTEDELLKDVRSKKLAELNKRCNEAILDRFASKVNGEIYYFSNDMEAQANFEKAEKAFDKGFITEMNWTCYDENGNVYRLRFDKTAYEKLYIDHLNHIQNNISEFRDVLMPQVENASLDELKNIKWEKGDF